jgi:hypothetical protein
MQKLSLHALNRVFASVEAVRNGPAFYALLSSFCFAGLLLAMAESALARADTAWGLVWGVGAVLVAFYGVNLTGLLLMDQALGRPIRDVQDVMPVALGAAARVLVNLLLLLLGAALVLGLLLAALWLVRLPGVGLYWFALMVPAGVLVLGVAGLAVTVLVGPLTGPSIWAGQGVEMTLRMHGRLLRHRLLDAAVLMAGVLALTALVSAVVSFVVMAGGRSMALISPWAAGVQVPPQQFMAGLFGYGLRSLGSAGAPVTVTAAGQAAMVGGGAVFALALVLPALIYLRGCCAVYLALSQAPWDEQGV